MSERATTRMDDLSPFVHKVTARRAHGSSSMRKGSRRRLSVSHFFVDHPSLSYHSNFDENAGLFHSCAVQDGSIMNNLNQWEASVSFDPQSSHVTIVVPTFIKHRSRTNPMDSGMADVTTLRSARPKAGGEPLSWMIDTHRDRIHA